MRINSHPLGAVNPAAVSDSNRAGRAGAAAGSRGPADAGQNPPAFGSSVVTLTATVMAQPDVRTAKVDALRRQVASGRYAPPLPATADKMLDDPMNGLDGDGHG